MNTLLIKSGESYNVLYEKRTHKRDAREVTTFETVLTQKTDQVRCNTREYYAAAMPVSDGPKALANGHSLKFLNRNVLLL